MFNHSIPEQVVYEYDIKREGIAIKATMDIHVGQELCLNYGFKSTSGIFINYGFVPAADREELQSIDHV